jgi:hypothetical protein
MANDATRALTSGRIGMHQGCAALLLVALVAAPTPLATGIIGTLLADVKTEVAIGLERDKAGELFLHLETNRNPERAEFAFTPGHLYSGTPTVVRNDSGLP